MPTLARITLFPIKSLDGCEVTAATVLASGGLMHDRRWAIVDADGAFINGKRSPTLHRIRAVFGDDVQSVELAAKDLRLIEALAAEVGVELPQSNVNLEVMDALSSAGQRERDFSAVAAYLRDRRPAKEGATA